MNKQFQMLSRVLLLAVLALSACSYAQISEKQSKTKLPKLERGLVEVSDDAILFRMEGKQMKNPSYIYGTMHMIGAEKFYFPEKFRKLRIIFRKLPFRPTLRFLYVYIWQKGFLDGWSGYIFARLHGQYEFLTIAKTKEKQMLFKNKNMKNS